MTIATTPTLNTQPLLLDVSNTKLTITPAQFDRLCIDNPDLRLELTPNLELIVMAPTGGESGKRNSKLNLRIGVWNEQTELGEVFDSSTGYDFTALGGGKPSPDVSWIEKSRLEGVNIVGLIPVVPDFVVELRSATDSLSETQTKMREYQRLGVRLGLLINPQGKKVEIYRLGKEVEILESPSSLVEDLPLAIDCSEVMPGFVLSMERIW
ncbi:Uma2 family endonuclease [Chamaesiphon sp. GL140_3_metabinner_50]|uniref:Uma2 family endonuclease n=1 Tax=Chamaesiphon sp. GL140_3_metabinner_50 TaxID=2970812 RepID=UPI0025E81387|nr:Uma2 family endonuclease [Chamaesiphon sp. GL140_3_metabinner_50]